MTRLSTRTLATYAGPGIPAAAIGLPLVIHLPPYYAGTFGLDLAAVGFVFFLVRMIDMPLDPILGHLMDGTRSRWGRFRPWVAAGGALLMASVAMLFFASAGVTIYYLFGWLMLTYAAHSMLNVGHMAWGATLSAEYHGRARVYGWWIAGHMAGLITVLILPALLGWLFDEGGPRPVHLMGGFILAAIPLTIVTAVALVREGPVHAEHPRITLADIRRLLVSRPLRLLFAADLVVNLAPGTTGALFQFVFHNLGFSGSEAATLLLVYFLSGLICLPLWLRLSGRIGKHRAAAVATALGLVVHVGAYLVFDADAFYVSVAAIFVAGIPYAAPGFLLRAMLADFSDEERLHGGADRIGLLNAVLTTAQKLGYALPVGMIFPVLAFVGFSAVPGIENTQVALRWVEALWLTLPVTLLVVATVLLARIPLDAARLAKVQTALAAQDAKAPRQTS